MLKHRQRTIVFKVLIQAHPDAAKGVASIRIASRRCSGWRRDLGTLPDPDGGHGMISDRERYDVDWSSLTPAEAALVDEFATALRQAGEEETVEQRARDFS